ncbi:uncharacterized protein C8R40DRAFT_1066270 [Lentinula edodes]|uniref:uncharacterized protein n=1 Tax=Lentinula edodes TaxID=5353 RepID=UPI001E8C9E96|nr:uncharacterized protein C8R40DRAFT_1066270 [Lentinula edodes]KAH7880174.1 hypothetical protein C8R40DRAFT_1066270 [Lentinula edodes]
MHFQLLSITCTLVLLVATAPVDKPRVRDVLKLANPKSITRISSTQDSANINVCHALTSIIGSNHSNKSKRADVQHPAGKSNVVLFHGTYSIASATALKSEVNLELSAKHGDLHSTMVFFWLLVNLHAEMWNQKPIFLNMNGLVQVKDYQAGGDFKAYLEYEKYAYPRNAALDQVMKDNVMISGYNFFSSKWEFSTLARFLSLRPMNARGVDDCLSDDFWQYALIKQQAATSNLKYITTYEVVCSAVPDGNKLNDVLYSASQKSSPVFPEMVKQLTECKKGPFDWHTAVVVNQCR